MSAQSAPAMGCRLPPADLHKLLAGMGSRDLTRGEPLHLSMVA